MLVAFFMGDGFIALSDTAMSVFIELTVSRCINSFVVLPFFGSCTGQHIKETVIAFMAGVFEYSFPAFHR